MTHITTAVPAGVYEARLMSGARLPVIGLDRDGRALVLDGRGFLTSVASFGAMLVEVAPVAPVAPVVNVAAPAPRTERAPAGRRPAPVAEEPVEEPEEDPVRRFRREQGLPYRGEAA